MRLLKSIKAKQPVSCVAFAPGYQDQVIVGTYALDQSEDTASPSSNQRRSGGITIYQLGSDDFHALQEFAVTSGILDIAIDPHDQTRLYAATSVGSVIEYRVQSKDNPCHDSPVLDLAFVHEMQILDPSILILDLEFHPTQPGIFGITTSIGHTCLVNISPSTNTSTGTNKPTDPSISLAPLHHSPLEAWTLSFSPSGTHLFFGADDSTLGTAHLAPSPLTFKPLPSGPPSTSPLTLSRTTTPADPSPLLPLPTSITTRVHTAGVVSILPLFTSPRDSSSSAPPTSILLTGSYDDHIRVVRPERKPVARTLAELNLGGGVWRTSIISQWVDSRDEGRRKWLVLVACMHAGAKVVEVRCERFGEAVEGSEAGDGGWEIEEVVGFEGHESMCYGAVVVPGEGRRRKVVSTSFYDKLVAEWEFEGPEWLDEVGEGI
ncbi:hypothetical protein BDZ85DRAFT_277612 [Elsinoe ampelina]|uniref:WD40-repeat-containing domain protein n=1 Tax=Elsinoe ampelina TaxID=302913 RepID=A0A6A6GPV6_9PEZI|nr:hypothetical protein BDZ85DRAFT_277612 [Elsinoe ampelina]